MNWNNITTAEQLDTISKESNEKPVLLFKHSTSCSISKLVLHKLEGCWEDDLNSTNYFLDLLKHRSLSSQIAERWGVKHESPQAIVIFKGAVCCHYSHMSIRCSTLKEAIEKVDIGINS